MRLTAPRFWLSIESPWPSPSHPLSAPSGDTALSRTRLLIAVSVLAVLVAASLLLPIDAWLASAETWTEAHPQTSAAFYLAGATVAAVLFVPGSVIAMVAGYLFGLRWGIPLALVGLSVGAAGAFVVGRLLVREWVRARLEARPRLRALDRAVNEQSFAIIALTRLSVIVPFNLLNYVFGVTGARPMSYVAATFIGMIPPTALWTYVGTLAKNLADIRAGQVETELPNGFILVFGVVVIATIVALIHRSASRALAEQLDE